MSGVIRTDLAMEARELHPELAGVEEENFVRDGVQVSRISITTPEAAEKLGKRMGLYITIDAPELPLKPTGLTDAVSRELARQIVTLMGDAAPDAPVLVAGLGNRAVTPDSLGPRVADAIYVTRHIKQYMAEAVPETVREVSALAPGVLGVTGVETREIIYGVVEHTKPAFIIAVDSLASRRAARISTTIQLTDTGISPGAGIGNIRSGLNEESLGVPVIAIGVPLVVYAGTIARDTISLIADETGRHEEEEGLKDLADRMIREHIGELIVTPKEIDALVSDMTKIVSDGINRALLGMDYVGVRTLIA
ncbi:MAG: Germination protease precursor [Firmicutes bacterium ADurb.Bin248]|jgi:spore protease|nr:MAG: Germination protease precursor [Firmicutes bacterium ADurb.Bin248]HOF99500.1 GPR endopeptidase [Clostridia bacterium]